MGVILITYKMHARATTQAKPKAISFSAYSKDYIKTLPAASSLESTEGIVGENSFAVAVDGLTEKSSGVREKSFLHIAGLLQPYSISEHSLESNQLTIQEAIKKGYRGSITERCLAARTAALFGISLGVDAEEFFQSLKPTFEAFVNPQADETSAAETICAWATLAFIVGDSGENTELIEKCISWLGNSLPAVQVASLNAIAFCCSSLPPSSVANSVIPMYGKILSSFIEPSFELSIRGAAGQLIS